MTDRPTRDNDQQADGGMAWSERDSAIFNEIGRIMIPRRDEIERLIVDLIPYGVGDAFIAVDIAAGTGWLSRAILERYRSARVVLLDGSETMLAEAGRTLAGHAGRFELRRFRLEEERWIEHLPDGVGCFVSSLALHHLDDAGKRQLFERLYAKLAPGAALLIADLIQPASETALRVAAAAWYEEVRRQALEMAGDLAAYEFFVGQRWNIFEYPDPADTPSTIAAQLRWLTEIGYRGVDVFWARAGHALYGGYKRAT